MKNIIISIPVQNEEKNIPILINRIKLLDIDLSILLVNDCSTDETGKVADRISDDEEDVYVVHRTEKEGLHAALITGIEEALRLGADKVITMDGDLSHRPEEIPDLINSSKDNDLVIGSRFISGGKTNDWSPLKKVMSFTARKMSRFFLGIQVVDCSSGFKLYSKKVLESYDFNNFITRGYAFQIESILRAEKNNFKIKEIPITFKGRIYGKSKVTLREIRRYLKSLATLMLIKRKI